MAFDTSRIIAQVVLKGALPDGRFDDQELLDFAYDALISDIVPSVMDAREDYYVRSLDYAVVAGQAAYDVPPRALFGALREVKLIRGTDVIDLDRIDLQDVITTTSGQSNSFYMQGNQFVVYPTPVSGGDTLRVFYFLRPNRLVSVAECGQITAIIGMTVSLSLPAAWTSSNTFDLIRGRAGFDTLDFDLSASAVGGGSITFTNALPSWLRVGDYVCLAEESCFPFLIAEAQVALIQAAVTSALESMGDAASIQSAQKTEALKQKFQNEISSRVLGAPKGLGTPLK